MDVRACEGCSKPYRPLKANQKLCPVCKSKKPVSELLTRTCPVCGKVFKTTLYNKMRCSVQCTLEANRDHSRDHGVVCKGCGKTFITGKSNKDSCSPGCANQIKREYDKEWRKKHAR